MSETKATNPKDLVGSTKIPMYLWPNTATIYGCLALFDGAGKYGRSNYRVLGVKSSVYYSALRRHLDSWFEGEDCASDSGLPHLAHALADLAILVEATEMGILIDDRMYPGAFNEMLKKYEPMVQKIIDRHANKQVVHYDLRSIQECVKSGLDPATASDTGSPIDLGQELASTMKTSWP